MEDIRKNRFDETRDTQTRDSQIRQYLQMEYEDKLFVDPLTIPSHLEYRWIRDSTLGQPDLSRMMEMNRKGWEPVPCDRHPELVPVDIMGRTANMKGYIFRDGLILCQRLKEYGDIERRNLQQRNMIAMQHLPGDEAFMNEPGFHRKVFVDETSIRTMQDPHQKSFSD